MIKYKIIKEKYRTIIRIGVENSDFEIFSYYFTTSLFSTEYIKKETIVCRRKLGVKSKSEFFKYD